MTKENKKSTDPSDTLSESKLWDEIMKALVYNMPDQLFPLIQEIYGISYPKGTSVQFLSTEQPQIPADASLTSQFMDLTVLINGTDYYHLECQMKNDHQMVIRMLSYDLHFAMQYCAGEDTTNGEMILHFPRSVVLYPEKNSRIPDHLRCRIIFQDNPEQASDSIYSLCIAASASGTSKAQTNQQRRVDIPSIVRYSYVR